MTRRAGRVLVWIGLWSLPALLAVAMTRSLAVFEGGAPTRPLSTDLLLQLPAWWIWALLSPGVYWLVGRLAPAPGRWARSIGLVLAVGLAVVALHNGLFVSALWMVGFFPPDAAFAQAYFVILSQTGPVHLFVFGGVAAVGVGLQLMQASRERELRASHLEAQLSRARLEALRMQLHPHFLFNALNTVAMRIRRGARREALELVVGFGELLRLILERERAMIALEGELDFARRYLEIEKARFGERLCYRIEAADGAASAAVPALLLQPLLENALRHGVARSHEPVRVWVEARRDADWVSLEVANDGPQLPSGWSLDTGTGIGLSNTLRRLSEAYGEAGALTLEDTEEGVRTHLRIPYRAVPPTDEDAADGPASGSGGGWEGGGAP